MLRFVGTIIAGTEKISFVLFTIFYREVAQAIVESNHWKKALRNTTYYSSGKYTTPLRQLITEMPGQYIECVGGNCGMRNQQQPVF